MKIRNFLFALTIISGVSAISTNAFANEPVTVPVASKSVNGYTLPSKESLSNLSVEEKQARMAAMKERVNEIKSMDKSQLTRQDRKELKTELKEMNREAKAMGERRVTGVYISIGALIIIILLLIIIL